MSPPSSMHSGLLTIERACRDFGFGAITKTTVLRSGMQCTPIRLTTSGGANLVAKLHPSPPPRWFEWEAEGLRSLAAVKGGLRVPKVHAFDESFLLMDDLGPPMEVDNRAWEEFGRALALTHQITAPLFGYRADNYLGVGKQINKQTPDGHAFFIEHRVLRYLHTPGGDRWLDAGDRRHIERLCNRIRKDVPQQPASFLHGDLHCDNIQGTQAGHVATFDPAVYFGWAEAELSLADEFGGFPQPFWNAYVEARPLHDGWRNRLGLYQLKELLALIEQFGNTHNSLTELRELFKLYD